MIRSAQGPPLAIVAPTPAQAVLDEQFPAFGAHCDRCRCDLIVRLQSVEKAKAHPDYHGVVNYLCILCARGVELSPHGVIDLRTPKEPT